MGQEKVGISDAGAVKAVGAFGGGVASSGGVCGTLLGGIALISSIYSRGSLAEKEDPRMWKLSKEFIARFEQLTKECGSTDCRDIARVDWSDREAVRDYYANPRSRRTVCIKLVGDAAYALGKLLELEADQVAKGGA